MKKSSWYSISRHPATWPVYLRAMLGLTFALGLVSSAVASGRDDFNGDDSPDYVLFNHSTRQTAIWYLHDNHFSGGVYGPTLPAGWVLVSTAFEPGDDEPDYILFNPTTRQTAIWSFSGHTVSRTRFGPTLPVGWNLVAAVDFDNNGDADYVLFNPSTRQTAVWFLDSNDIRARGERS